MKTLTFDVETTTHGKGNPYSKFNKLCYVGLLDWNNVYHQFPIEYDQHPYGEHLEKIQELINECDLLVGFNIKFDLSWIRRYGIKTDGKRVFDCQLAQFVLSHQSNPYPSLNDTALLYGFDGKLDEVKEYWDAGIDTPDIPRDILEKYLEQDVRQTFAVYEKQVELLEQDITMYRLVRLQCLDLLVLLDIEWNGLLYDTARSLEEGNKLQSDIDDLDRGLRDAVNFPDLNPGSGEHLSAILYGGKIKGREKLPYEFHHKDGRVSIKEKWFDTYTDFPRLVTPAKGTELAKEGYYSVSDDVLRSLRASGKGRSIINMVRQRNELNKRVSTYLHGLPKKIEEMGWEGNYIHGQLNQCVARTGRLSSSNP